MTTHPDKGGDPELYVPLKSKQARQEKNGHKQALFFIAGSRYSKFNGGRKEYNINYDFKESIPQSMKFMES